MRRVHMGPGVVSRARRVAGRMRATVPRVWAAGRGRVWNVAAVLRCWALRAGVAGRVRLALAWTVATLVWGAGMAGARRVRRRGLVHGHRLNAQMWVAARRVLPWLIACLNSRVRVVMGALRAVCARASAAAAPDADQPDDGLEIVSAGGIPAWGQRLSPRARVGRAITMVGAVCLAIFVAVGGPGTALALVGSGWDELFGGVNPRPLVNALPIHLNASNWAAARLPGDAFRIRGIQLRPSPGDPGVAYACWPEHPTRGTEAAAVQLYVTADGAHSWTALHAPVTSAAQCRLVLDAADPRRVLLLTYPGDPAMCGPPGVFASDDGGTTWTPVGLPASLPPGCDLAFFSLGGRLFAWSGRAQTALAEGPAAQLLTSVDEGASWSPAFPHLPAGVVVTLVAAHMDGSLLALLSPAADQVSPARPATRTLWCAAPGMAQWSPIAQIPPGTERVLASDDPGGMVGCRWGTLYALGFIAGDAAGVGAASQIAVSTQGDGWRDVPPLRDVGGAPGLPLGTDGLALTVGPAGTLLIDVPYSGNGPTGIGAPQRVIWAWDPATGRWLRDYQAEPGNASIEGYAWDHSQGQAAPRLVIWLYSLNWGMPAFTGIFKSNFAPRPMAPAGLPGVREGERTGPGAAVVI